MKIILIFSLICISIFSAWLPMEEYYGFDRTEKSVGLYNFNGSGGWILIDKVEEYIPIFSENGKQIFTNPQNSYYKITFGFEDYLLDRTINKLQTIKVSNDKNEIIKELNVKVKINNLYTEALEKNDADNFINFLKNSNSISLFFKDDNGKVAVQKFNTEGFNNLLPLIQSQKELVKSSLGPSEDLNLSPESKYIKNFMSIDYINVIKNENSSQISFRIKNDGEKSISSITILVKYLDMQGKIIMEKELYPVYEGGTFGKLEPYSVYKLKKYPYFYENNIPKEWSGNCDIEIKNIKF